MSPSCLSPQGLVSQRALYPRRTDEAFFCHYLPITPEEAFVESNPVPQDFQTFEEMWDWYQPLIDSESNMADEKQLDNIC